MTNVDFSVQDVVPRNRENEYVLLQAGKGKAKFTKIYINHHGFSYVEGLIWDKYREFSREKITKIHSEDFDRIIEGLRKATTSLEDNLDDLEIKSTLKFNLARPKYKLSHVQENFESFTQMLIEITEWLSKVISQEKYVYIKYNK